jgi:hypothetical protein
MESLFPSEYAGYVTNKSYNPDPNVKQQRLTKTTDVGDTGSAKLKVFLSFSVRSLGLHNSY